MNRRQIFAAALAATGALCLAGPALASQTNTQTLDGVIGSTVSMTGPSSAVNFGTFAIGANTAAGGTMAITANVPYTLTVTAEKATMTEYSGGAYVARSPKTLAAPTVVTVTSSDIGATPLGAVSSALTALPLATGLAGAHTYTLSLAQAISVTDAPAAYHNLLSYTAAPTVP